MAASYKKLFKLLIDREMKSKDLAEKAGISPATLAKMKKDTRLGVFFVFDVERSVHGRRNMVRMRGVCIINCEKY